MSFWSNLFGGARKAPSWSAITDAAQFDRFIAAAMAVLDEAEVDADEDVVRSGSVMISRSYEWILHEVAETCAAAPEEQWPTLLKESFVRLRGGKVEAPSDADDPEDSEDDDPEGDGSLRLQLFGEVMKLTAGMVTRPVAPGITAVLVRNVAGGAGERTVAADDPICKGRSPDALLDLAHRNSVAADADAVVMQQVGPFEVAVSNSFYLGACVLEALNRMVVDGGEAPDGVLVVMLSWHHFITIPAGTDMTPELFSEMARLTQELSGKIKVGALEFLSTDIFLWRRAQPAVRVTSWPPSE